MLYTRCSVRPYLVAHLRRIRRKRMLAWVMKHAKHHRYIEILAEENRCPVSDILPLYAQILEESLLATDVVANTDGGGRLPSALEPIYGQDKIARSFVGMTRKRGTSPDK